MLIEYLHVYIFSYFFPSGCYKILNIVPCAIHYVLFGVSFICSSVYMGFPGGAVIKDLSAKCRRKVQSWGQEDSVE